MNPLKGRRSTQFYPDRLTAPINGVFEFRAANAPPELWILTPRFKSYEANATSKILSSTLIIRWLLASWERYFVLVAGRKFSEIVVRNPMNTISKR
jgi:hypothetical protein